MYFATRSRSSLTTVYSDSGYAVITDHALSNIIFEILRFFLVKVEDIFKILEVNFGFLAEVIFPTSKSQGSILPNWLGFRKFSRRLSVKYLK